MKRGPMAYAHARIRACKSRLLTRTDAAPLFTATDDATMQRVLSVLGIDDPLQRTLRVYVTALRGYRHELLRALLRLHEIENVKLLWRVAVKRGAPDSFSHLWLDLGDLASVPMIDATTVNELAEKLAGTPYAAIAATVARAHGSDIAAAELALDRWATQRLREEARRLPRREALSRKLIELIARERDAQIALRGAKWFGLTSVAGDAAADVTALRRERLRLCRRAFVGSPFLLAPALAVVLLAEEEARAVRALIERKGDEHLDAPMLRAVAASQIGT